MPSFIIKNVSDGPKIVNALLPFILKAGESTGEPVEISEAELAVIAEGDWFEVDGEEGDDLSKLSVAKLKELAAEEQIDLGDATKKADIIAAIELGREAKQA